MYDIIVVGGGPAGMTAALYARRNGKSVLVSEKYGFGGQITHSPKVENYPGTLSMSGNEFADQMLEQILAQGADIEIEEVTSVQPSENGFTVTTDMDSEYECRAVIFATGVKHRMLGLPGEGELVGEGISFCAVCDGDFYSGRDVCMAGGGNSALQEAILLSDKCKSVTVLQDLPQLTGEASLQKVLAERDNVRVLTGVKITGLLTSEGEFRGVSIEQEGAGAQEISCDGLFVAIGLIPENEPFAALASLNDYGYFDSDERCVTGTPGIFVAGDCRSKTLRQLTTVVSDGAQAAMNAIQYINGR